MCLILDGFSYISSAINEWWSTYPFPIIRTSTALLSQKHLTHPVATQWVFVKRHPIEDKMVTVTAGSSALLWLLFWSDTFHQATVQRKLPESSSQQWPQHGGAFQGDPYSPSGSLQGSFSGLGLLMC